MLDCGFGIKETERRLARLGIETCTLTGILVTHEHDDHAGGAFKLAARHRIPVWLTHGTLRGAQCYLPKNFDNRLLNIIDSLSRVEINDIEVQPYPVPHDAEEPVQYVFSEGQRRLGVLTDTGASTPHIEQRLDRCHALAIECNHDLDMLKNGPYAWPLKKRVMGRYGHLDNASAAGLLSRLDQALLQHVIALHLSEKNNTPALAGQSLAAALGSEPSWVGIATQSDGFGWREIG